jgi:cell division septum initiation protein DivIVA
VRTLAARARPGAPLDPESVAALKTALDELHGAAEAEARDIVGTAREDARRVLEAARLELTGLVAQILDLWRLAH